MEQRPPLLLIAGDRETTIEPLQPILSAAGYTHLNNTSDCDTVLTVCARLKPDLLILDIATLQCDRLTNWIGEGKHFPILFTGAMIPPSLSNVLATGGNDFIRKPFDSTEVLLRIKNLLQSDRVALNVQKRESDQAQIEMLQLLALAAEYRQDSTGQHTRRVGEMSALLSRSLGLTEDEVELIRRAAPLHDIGMLRIPDRILFKRGDLNEEDREQIKSHTNIGAEILSGSHVPVLQMAEDIAYYHHEHWDGSGYHGYQEESIPLAARVVSLVDRFDALTHGPDRQKDFGVEEALADIWAQSGQEFDPRIVDAFLYGPLREQLLEIGQASGETSSSEYGNSSVEGTHSDYGIANILVVDDSADHRALLTSMLRTAGYPNVLVARSADEAFHCLELHAGQDKIDVVLMDVVMPGTDGIQACEQIRSKLEFHDLPVIMVTGQTSANDLETAFTAGANDYVTKPLNRLELLARVRSTLKLKDEMDCRKLREQELMEASRQLREMNRVLLRLYDGDGLTASLIATAATQGTEAKSPLTNTEIM